MISLRKYKFHLVFLSISVFIILLDQITKFLAVKFNPQIDFRLFLIHLVKNTGAGFGILKDYNYLLTFISLAVALAVILMYNKIPQKIFPQICSALFLGGVAGNLIDRLFRQFVVDFIDFKFWPAFNIADMCISIAVIGLIIYFWRE